MEAAYFSHLRLYFGKYSYYCYVAWLQVAVTKKLAVDVYTEDRGTSLICPMFDHVLWLPPSGRRRSFDTQNSTALLSLNLVLPPALRTPQHPHCAHRNVCIARTTSSALRTPLCDALSLSSTIALVCICLALGWCVGQWLMTTPPPMDDSHWRGQWRRRTMLTATPTMMPTDDWHRRWQQWRTADSGQWRQRTTTTTDNGQRWTTDHGLWTTDYSGLRTPDDGWRQWRVRRTTDYGSTDNRQRTTDNGWRQRGGMADTYNINVYIFVVYTINDYVHFATRSIYCEQEYEE